MKKQVVIAELTKDQLKWVVGGVGAGAIPGAGISGWGLRSGPSFGNGLVSAGFSPPGALNPNSAVQVTVPGQKA